MHEFGHNVEQVTDLYHIDYYPLAGVPNSATTEAMAFLFQARDLQLLGYGRQKMDDNATLDIFWGMYEIMGVSLVDMYTWRWLYAHPDATAAGLRRARPYAVVAILSLSALLTPPDVASQILLAVPTLLLYEIGILLARSPPPPSVP